MAIEFFILASWPVGAGGGGGERGTLCNNQCVLWCPVCKIQLSSSNSDSSEVSGSGFSGSVSRRERFHGNTLRPVELPDSGRTLLRFNLR